ncbi:MAG: hypothetical protein H6600_02230 [Flavobacteriales bacterium]|nr:hypothetical protein [Flavobacteriales bacterium]
MKNSIYLFLISILVFSCSDGKTEAFRQYITYDYHFNDSLINYKLNNNILELEFPNGTEFDKWFLNVLLYTDNNLYSIDSVVLDVKNNKIKVPFNEIPNSFTNDSIIDLRILAAQQKCLLFDQGAIVQKPYYIKETDGVLKININNSDLSLTRIEYEAWELTGKDLEEFSMFYDSLTNQ